VRCSKIFKAASGAVARSAQVQVLASPPSEPEETEKPKWVRERTMQSEEVGVTFLFIASQADRDRIEQGSRSVPRHVQLRAREAILYASFNSASLCCSERLTQPQ
jgi:hypothetical protein